ncbi:IS21 family transposase [Proteiniborus sp.]|uniref:IS21 family transposase n=1 Tax=Proteiniborus sp. TaxID=2079015 RepID=UPI00332D3599
MKNLREWAAVQELHKRKVPILRIAKQLKMSRNTVKKLIKLKEEPKYTRNHYPSKIESYMNQILIWRTSPEYDFNGTRIFRELVRRGYDGSINPIYRALKKIDEEKTEISRDATVRIETPPGDQAQYDWSEYQVVVNESARTVYCFSMILAASRKKAICFSLSCDADAIYESIQELYDDLGGVTLELLIDNPKALVIENNPKSEDEIKYNEQALLLVAHLGTELNACNCYWPRTKGKIEKPFQYIEEQFIKGNTFSSMEELNRRGKEFIRDWNGEMHTTTRRVPNEFFENEEIQALLPLPNTRFRMKALEKRIISNDGYIHINTNKYSVPIKYATKQLKYRIVYGFRIEIYTEQHDYIMSLELQDGKHGIFKNPKHYEDIKVKASKSIPQIKRDFTSTFKNGEAYLKAATGLFQQPSYHARKILELLDLYEPEILDKVIAYAIANNKLDIKSIKQLIRNDFFKIIADEVKTKKVIKSTDTDGIIRSLDYYEESSEVTAL